MQSRLRLLRLEAEKVAAVQMIGKADHVRLKTLARDKQFVLAAGHRRQSLWSIFSNRLPRHSQLFLNVHDGTPLIRIGAAEGIELLRSVWRKWDGVNTGVGFSDQPDNIVQLDEHAAMVAGFADQQQYTLTPPRP